MNKLFALLATLITTLAVPAVVFAQTPTTTDTSGSTNTTPAAGTKAQERLAQRQANLAQKTETLDTNLKTRGDNEIDRRITALNTLISRIGAFKKLSADQKASFTTQIQTEISNLTTLKAKIDADTDTTSLRTDVKAIVIEYRVFAFYIPQLRILESADRMLTVADDLTTLSTKLQQRIADASAAGKDVTSLTPTLTDMQAKIADAKTQAQNAITAVAALTPAGYPTNRSVLQSAQKTLQSGKQDLMAATADGKTIIQTLHLLGAAKSSSVKTGLTPTSSAGTIPTTAIPTTAPTTTTP